MRETPLISPKEGTTFANPKEKEMKLFPADQSEIDNDEGNNLFDVLDKVDDIDSD